MSARTFHLPDLGEGLTEAEVVSWAVEPGESIVVDQVIATVETAKAQVELPSPFAGQVLTLHGGAGAVIDVGAPFLTVEVDDGGAGDRRGSADVAPAGYGQPRDEATAQRLADERGGSGNVLIGYGTSEAKRGRRRRVGAPAGGAVEARIEHGARPSTTSPATPDSTPDSTPGSRPGGAVRVISPLVRRLAAEHGVDLQAVRPSAPGGIITKADVEAAIGGAGAAAAGAAEQATGGAQATGQPDALTRATEAPEGSPARRASLADERVPITGIRKVIADKLSASRREIPDATTWVDVDATGLRTMRDDLAACVPQARIGYLALLARITVAGLRRFPELNARVDTAAGEIVRVGAVHLSFAAQGPRGLVVPVLHHADALTTEELAASIRALVERAKAGTLAPEEMSGGTFTLNNYGVYGVDGSTPIINHPEAGMLGVGRIVDKPWVVDEALAVRPVTQLSLSFDHRVCDGGVAGGFLRYVADCVERPGALLAGL